MVPLHGLINANYTTVSKTSESKASLQSINYSQQTASKGVKSRSPEQTKVKSAATKQPSGRQLRSVKQSRKDAD